jgi:hypothetical protein
MTKMMMTNTPMMAPMIPRFILSPFLVMVCEDVRSGCAPVLHPVGHRDHTPRGVAPIGGSLGSRFTFLA